MLVRNDELVGLNGSTGRVDDGNVGLSEGQLMLDGVCT